jgi:hypothetical protein
MTKVGALRLGNGSCASAARCRMAYSLRLPDARPQGRDAGNGTLMTKDTIGHGGVAAVSLHSAAKRRTEIKPFTT